MAVTKGQIGSKHYNIETADLVDTLPNGFMVYRKKGRASAEGFRYYPKGQTVKESFFPLSPKDNEKYLAVPDETDKGNYRSGAAIQISRFDRDRIKRLANLERKTMVQFILMLVDEYERTHNEATTCRQ